MSTLNLDAIRYLGRAALAKIDHPLAQAILRGDFDGLELDEQWDNERTVVTDGTAAVVFEGGGASLCNPQSLVELLDAVKARTIPLSDSLPDFGGEEPGCTVGVWSWDETALLVGDCAGDLELVPREQHEAEIQTQRAEDLCGDRETTNNESGE